MIAVMISRQAKISIVAIGIVCLLFVYPGNGQGIPQAQIISVSPMQNAINIQPNTALSVTFDDGMDPGTINDTTFFAMASQSGLHTGTISYNTITNSATLDPVQNFIDGEVVAVHVTSAIQDTLGVFFAGFVWNFTIASVNGTGGLKPARQYAAHGYPRGISTADLNEDGILDLIIANQGTNDFSVLIGYGNGGFYAPVNTLSGSEPVDVVCGDLDNDGFIDWVIVARVDNAVYGYLNDGGGSGTSTGQFATGTSPLQAVLADLDGDGYLDCATVNNGTNDMGVLMGNGDGTFQSVTTYAIGPNPQGIHCGDFNEDGWIDLVVTRTGNARIVLFQNDGDGTFTNTGNVLTGTSPYPVMLASFDTVDNYLDLVSANSGSNNISVALGTGTGSFTAADQFVTPARPQSITVCDMNADGALDIIVSTVGSDSIAVMLNDSAAQFNSYSSFYGGDSILRVCSGDFNLDGAMDIAVVCYNEDSVTVFLNTLDTIPPYIVSTIPDSGETNISVNSNVYIMFNEPMDTSIIDTTKFYISGSVSPAYTYSVTYDTLTFTAVLDPDSLFAVAETITVDVSPTLADTAGNQMGTPYSFYFVTAMSSDTIGPLVTTISVVPDTSQGAHYAVVLGTISDSTTGMSIIQDAEIFFDSTGQNGTGIPLNPVDGSWDEIVEDVSVITDISVLSLGDHWIHMHGFDGGEWGSYDSVLLVITPDDDTTGPSFAGFTPDSVPDTSAFHISCVITDSSGVYDDSTGSSGQGVFLLWDNDGEIVITYQEMQMSLMSGDTFQTDTQIPQQDADANVVYEIYAYDNDFDFNEPDDRTQGQSGIQLIVIYDAQGPVTTQVQISPPNPPAGITEVVVYADISDSTTGVSIIAGAEAFLDSIGSNGTGYSMQAVDGVFNEVFEAVYDTIPVSGWAVGDTHTFYVHGQDEYGNWGLHDSAVVVISGVVDTTGPGFLITVTPAPAYVGDTILITAIASETLHADSVVMCSLITNDTVLVFMLEGDTTGYSNMVSTIGYQPGDCYLTVFGYDLLSNFGIAYDTIAINLQGEFLPEDQVYAWPNPAQDNTVNFHFYVNANADVTVDVYTIEGKKVITLTGRGQGGRPAHQIDSNVIQWNITDVASDVYIFRLTAISDVDGQTRSVMKKFAIVH